MNPLPIAWTLLKANRLTSLLFLFLFLVLIAIAVALGVAITAQERALRDGSARAAQPFDLIVAAPGSRMEVMFNVVYLRASAVEMLPNEIVTQLMGERGVEFAAPLAFGDNAGGYPIVGTITDLVTHLGGVAEGASFTERAHAVAGADTPFAVGDSIVSAHGDGSSDQGDHGEMAVVGRLAPTGTVWDRAVLVPIEFMWEAHSLATGHADPDAPIGPPYDPAFIGGVPALVVKPADLPTAYGLRQSYRTERSTAFFPAEVLAEIYGYLGDVRSIMNLLTIATQVLVVAAILAGIVALMQLYRTRLAVLRALGATRSFVFLVMWVYVMALILGGAVLGLAGGWGVAGAISSVFAAETGMNLRATLGGEEFALVGTLLGLGALLAALPAWALFRKPPVAFLR
ncbi:MAG: FtsX-like permease family protein [Pseudomonadota bacterium]